MTTQSETSTSVMELLSSTGLFNVLDAPTLLQVERELVREHLPGGAKLFSQGDPGGVLNNLPGDVMKQICGGKVIVVDVSPQKDLGVNPGMSNAPSSAEVIWSKINPLKEAIDVPNVLAIMMRTVMLSSTQTSQDVAKKVDLYVRPPIDGFGLFEWKALEKLAEAGYEFGRTKLAEWTKQRSVATANAAV